MSDIPDSEASDRLPPSPVRMAISLVGSIAGLGVATYLTVAHYDTALQVVCPQTSTFNCEKVTTSPQSFVFGIPVAVLGLVYFVPMVALCLPVAWRSASRLVAAARVGLAVTGIAMVCYLVHAELFEIHAICIWCTSVHALTFIVFVAVVTGLSEVPLLPPRATRAPT